MEDVSGVGVEIKVSAGGVADTKTPSPLPSFEPISSTVMVLFNAKGALSSSTHPLSKTAIIAAKVTIVCIFDNIMMIAPLS
jgi:hypothetical protein